jgi:hypothetical protein
MAHPQKIAQYIQRLGLEDLIRQEEREERPEDAPRAPDPTPNYASWSATSFSAYVPFRSPTTG